MTHMSDLQRSLEAFRAMEPVPDVLDALRTAAGDVDTWLSVAYQTRVMDEVVRDQVCDRHPPQLKYVYRLLKRYMEEIEAAGRDVSDDLVEGLMDFVLSPQLVQLDVLDADAMHHVSFTVHRGPRRHPSVVTCRVASVSNEVGLRIWEAGWFLAEYVAAHAHEFQGRSVLELGAGVGFTGLALAVTGGPRRLLLTDYAPSVMQNLRYNVEINTDKFRCPVAVQALDWETWEPADGDLADRPDVFLAGDCVYDVSVFPFLMRVLDLFLGVGNDVGAEAPAARSAIFAATIRNQKTFQEFLDQLAAHRISYVDITSAAVAKMGEQRYRYANRDQIRLCRLTRSSRS